MLGGAGGVAAEACEEMLIARKSTPVAVDVLASW